MDDIIQLSSKKFLAGCALLSLILLGVGQWHPFSSGIMGLEVFVTIIGLFVFGSMRYQLDKNALTYGAAMVIASTFATSWWPNSNLKDSIRAEGFSALVSFLQQHILSLHSLDELIHADTMLFILGLTFFVSVIAQTRILESICFVVLRKNKGFVFPTIGILIGLVAFSSGILDGVSMIGLLIRTMVIVLFLSKIKDDMTIFAVIVSTVITTVCGMWLAYGEPPNLIMKANLHPHLSNAFFLRYCLPVAFGSFLIVLWNVWKNLRGKRVALGDLDILDEHTADVRFLQAYQHGDVPMPIEFIEVNKDVLGSHFEKVLKRLHAGEALGLALVRENISKDKRMHLLTHFVSETLAPVLDQHYLDVAAGREKVVGVQIISALENIKKKRLKTQWIGAISFLPFISLLIWHGLDHSVNLFWSSITAFFVAMLGILPYKKMFALAMHEAKHEYKEYLFLFPLFLSITLLQKSGFFEQMSSLLHQGIESLGVGFVAFIQYAGAVILSALLDNNVVADFASRALHGLEISILHLFAMAQIAGYALGGCWTHIGSAQSVVAFAFIKKEINPKFSPFQWIKMMTPIVIQISILMIIVIFIENALAHYLG